MIATMHKKLRPEKDIVVDTTVQEKNITHSIDSKLNVKSINSCWKITKEQEIQLRRTYCKEVKQHELNK